MRIKENHLINQGYKLIAGVDEAGRGPLAGPVVAAAVILDPKKDDYWSEVKDSKQLSPAQRDRLFKIISLKARSVGIGLVDVALIDKINIYQASLEAMKRAVQQLSPPPHYVLSDGFALPDLDFPNEAVRSGDALCLSIAAASIIAKVLRDNIMQFYDRIYPGYGFARHKGYPTPEHRQALKTLGVSPIHRRTFKLF
ncbi:MAG: ribonuclease HII [Dethiobacteria bacterium]